MKTLHSIPNEIPPFHMTEDMRNRIGDLIDLGYRRFLFAKRRNDSLTLWVSAYPDGNRFEQLTIFELDEDLYRGRYNPDRYPVRVIHDIITNREQAGECFDRAIRITD